MNLTEVAERSNALLDELCRAVVGKREALRLVLLGLLADGHVLIEDYPGLAKTLIARSFAQVADLRFSRIQFTPDLMPSDVTGSSIFDQRAASFEFRPGPVFANLLLADEINRAPPKTQAALLEAMQERQVTIEGQTRRLDRPFLVLATQNPIEYEGTYPLPEAQLDRFLLRMSVGYPDRDDELAVLDRRRERRTDDVELRTVVDGDDAGRDAAGARGRPRRAERRLLHRRRRPRDARKPKRPGRREPTRQPRDPQARTGDRGARRPRLRASRTTSRRSPGPRSAHRLSLKPELWVQRIRPEDVVQEQLETVPTPPAEDVRRRRVTRAASPKLVAYATLGGLGLLAALVTGRPELAAIALPFLAVLGAALVLARRSAGRGREQARARPRCSRATRSESSSG